MFKFLKKIIKELFKKEKPESLFLKEYNSIMNSNKVKNLIDNAKKGINHD